MTRHITDHNFTASSRLPEESKETDFGFRTVPTTEKKNLVREVFDSVAPRYDIMNDLMSLGIHRIWKRLFITKLAPHPSLRLLDLASGTGDIAFGWLKNNGGHAIMTDVNVSMLFLGRDRALNRGLISSLSFCVADAETLPFPDMSVDRVSIAFGLRNCTDKIAVIREARRVLRPGGRFFCLEFSKVQIAALSPLYEAWSFKVLPTMGKIVAKDRASYQYLAESIRTFPDPETLADMFRQAKFSHVTYQLLSGGIVAIHSGWRL